MNDEAYQVSTPLFRAIERGRTETVKELLAAGADPDECIGEDEDTALLIASIEGKADIARLLLEFGANVNLGDSVGYTPLMGAVCAHSLPVVRMLLEAGANVHSVCGRSGATALHDAARSGRPEIVRMLLAAGADPNGGETLEGETVLMGAVQSLSPEVVELLLDHGADAYAVSSRQDSALEYAQNALECVWEPEKTSNLRRIVNLLAHAPHVAD